MRINSRLSTEINDPRNLPRRMACCPDTWSKPGDSLLLLRVNNVTFALHRECLSNAVELMPMSETAESIQREWDGLRDAIREQGKMFPEVNDVLESSDNQ